MNLFDRLPQVEIPEQYVTQALERTNRKVSQATLYGSPAEKASKKETRRILLIKDTMIGYLEKIHNSWPSVDELPEFYIRLINNTLSHDKLKKSLGAIHLAEQSIKEAARKHVFAIKELSDRAAIRKESSAFISKLASIIKRVRKEMIYLETARNVIKEFPSLNPEEYTIAIAGFPNVGKSTLLQKMTGAQPEIKNYAFTTKGLNVGTLEYKFSNIQFVDTPGTLARDKENTIERLATITRQYLAKMVIYVYDATETYPMEDQERLRELIEEEGHEILFYLSKTDVLPQATIDTFKKKHPYVITDHEELLTRVKKSFDMWM